MNNKERECVANLSYESEIGFERFSKLKENQNLNEFLNGWAEKDSYVPSSRRTALPMANRQQRTFEYRTATPLVEIRNKSQLKPQEIAVPVKQLMVNFRSFGKFSHGSNYSENFVKSFNRKIKIQKTFNSIRKNSELTQYPCKSIKIRSILPEKSPKKEQKTTFLKTTSPAVARRTELAQLFLKAF